MNPIISPWWFYWIDVLWNVKVFLVVLITISFVVVVILYIVGFVTYDNSRNYGDDDKDLKFANKILIFSKNITICLFVCGLLLSIIPSRQTMYTMLVAQNVTYENVEKAAGIIQDSVDYIFDKFYENK